MPQPAATASDSQFRNHRVGVEVRGRAKSGEVKMDTYTSSSGILLSHSDFHVQRRLSKMAHSRVSAKGMANRSKSLANLNIIRQDDEPEENDVAMEETTNAVHLMDGFMGTLKKRRWKAMASGISSIRRLVKPGHGPTSPSTPTKTVPGIAHASSDRSPTGNTCTVDSSEVGPHRKATACQMAGDGKLHRRSSGNGNENGNGPRVQNASVSSAGGGHVTFMYSTDGAPRCSSPVSTSFRAHGGNAAGGSNNRTSSLLSAAERFWTMRRNGRNSRIAEEDKTKSSATSVRIVQGLAPSSSELPSHAVCVNPYFLAHFRGSASKQNTGSVFLTQPMHILNSYPGSPQSCLLHLDASCSSLNTDRSAGHEASPSPPPSYDEMTCSSDDQVFTSSGLEHIDLRYASDGGVSCSDLQAGVHAKEHSDSSSACSFSSTSCATWSQNHTPSRRQDSGYDASYNEPAVRRFSSGSPTHNAYSRRQLPPLPTFPPCCPEKSHGRGHNLCARDSGATVSPISTSSSTSSMYALEERSFLLENFDMVKKLNWYWGPLTREQSEEILMKASVGDVLLRDSNNHTHYFVLSVRCQDRVMHVLTDNKQLDMEWKDSETATFQDILRNLNPKIVLNKHGQACARGKELFPHAEVLLLSPVVRYSHVPSLQHLCRLAIRGKCLLHKDAIAKMELPRAIKTYLKEPNVFPNTSTLPLFPST